MLQANHRDLFSDDMTPVGAKNSQNKHRVWAQGLGLKQPDNLAFLVKMTFCIPMQLCPPFTCIYSGGQMQV